MIEYLDEQFYLKPSRILKLRFYYGDELIDSKMTIQELTEKVLKKNDSVANINLRYDIDLEWNIKTLNT